jgi:hypothetical protein
MELSAGLLDERQLLIETIDVMDFVRGQFLEQVPGDGLPVEPSTRRAAR